MTKQARGARQALSPEIVALKRATARHALGLLSQAIQAGTLVRVPIPDQSRTLRKL